MTTDTDRIEPPRAAEQLVGLVLNERWRVVDRLPSLPERTASVFSVGYLVQDVATGSVAFCKALDYSAAFAADDPEEELRRLADAFIFERDLLEQCEARRLTRIVRALDSGRIRVDGGQPPMVSFLVFERADSDSRDILDGAADADALIAVSLAHDCAVAVAQLHRHQISHQDIKPANVLGWRTGPEQWSGKLGDLGRAFCATLQSPHAELCCPGDKNWAPPEILYDLDSTRSRALLDRRLADLYSLGSLTCYLLTRVPYGGLLALSLASEHHWTKWQGGYSEAKSFLAEAHERALERLREVVHVEAADHVIPLIAELCNPDVAKRGYVPRHGTPSDTSRVALERYIGRLDLISHRIKVSRARESVR